MAVVNEGLAEKLTGHGAPRSFILDASVLEQAESHKVIREDVKLNRVEFEFPSGVNKLSVYEECRAMSMLEDFEAMYDFMMQSLVDKDLVIRIKNADDTKTELCAFHVTDRYQNLRGVDAIDEYPVLVQWLTEFIGASLLKKYPLPGKNVPQNQTAKKKTRGTGGKTSSRS